MSLQSVPVKSRVLFINPPVLCAKGTGVDIFQPTGLAYLAASARAAGYQVFLLDAPALGWTNQRSFDCSRDVVGLSFGDIYENLRDLKPDFVCITIPFTLQKDSAFCVASLVRKAVPGAKVIVGGPHVSVRPEECAKELSVDYAIRGEGEIILVKLLDLLCSGTSEGLENLPGLAFRSDNGSVLLTPPPELIPDLNSLPFPARDLLPMNIYFEAAKKQRANRDLSKRWASVITSRGCPFNCVFCSIHLTMGRRWRYRSSESVIAELKELVSVYGIEQISFEDDNISCDSSRMEKICDSIIQEGLQIEWFTPNGIRADTLNERLLSKMKKSGCRELWFAPESGSQRVVDEVIDKRLDLEYIKKMVSVCKEVGISSNAFFVIGLPGESKDDLLQTVKYAQDLQKLGADNCLFSIATPLYGTRLYQQALESGSLMNFNDSSLMYGRSLLTNLSYSEEELLRVLRDAQSNNRRLYISSQLSKILYYLKCRPSLIKGPIISLFRLGRIFLSRSLRRVFTVFNSYSMNTKIRNSIFVATRGLQNFLSYWTNYTIPPRPSVMYLEMTYRCNCRCQFCQRWQTGPEQMHNELSEQEIKDLLDQAYSLGVRYLGITGGEALLRPDTLPLARYARSLGMSVVLASNGVLINESNVDLIRESCDSVTISMDGINSQTHDQIRGVPGVYEKAMAAIKLLKSKCFSVAVNMVITKNNYREIDDYISFFGQLGVPLQLTPVHEYEENHFKISPELQGLDFSAFESYWHDLSSKHFFLRSFFYKYIPEFFRQPDHLGKKFVCFAGSAMFFVDPYGNVFPCEFYRKSLGNIRERSLDKLWESALSLRRLISSPKRPCVCWNHCVVPLNKKLTKFIALKKGG